MEKNIVNEEIMNELKGIQWSTDSEGSATEKTEIKEVENKEVENKEDVVMETAGEDKEVENKEVDKEKDAEPKVDAGQTAGKKRDVLKFGNKNWVEEIPENERYNEKTVFCWNPGTDDKIGYFAKYGKKEGMIWINMYKKDSFTLMSREWAARLSDCEVIEQDGKMLSDRYFKDEKGYHVKKEEKKEVVAETAVETAKVPEAITESNTEIKEEKVNTEMPLAE